MATIYLIHFDQPVGALDNPRGQAQHYLGSANKLKARLARHAAGDGARLMEVVKERGIPWRLARTWQGPRRLERQLKRRHEAPRLCPICNPNAAQYLHRWANKSVEEICNGH